MKKIICVLCSVKTKIIVYDLPSSDLYPQAEKMEESLNFKFIQTEGYLNTKKWSGDIPKLFFPTIVVPLYVQRCNYLFNTFFPLGVSSMRTKTLLFFFQNVAQYLAYANHSKRLLLLLLMMMMMVIMIYIPCIPVFKSFFSLLLYFTNYLILLINILIQN